MPRTTIDALSDVQVRSVKPRARQYKLSDGRGLYLLVKPTGSRLWRLNFRFAGKPRLAALGEYPDTSLVEGHLDPLEEAGKAETLRRVRQRVNAVFSYAVQTGLRPDNPVREMRGAYDAPVREHFASITPKELPAFLARLGQYRGHESTIGLIRMILWTACRTAEVRGAVWSEFDLDEARWVIPAERMKKRRAHVVPLPVQAVALLRRLEQSRQGEYVFPSQGKPDAIASENIVLQALKKMGYSTEVIKAQLSHAKASLTDAAYLRGVHVEKRAAMMQAWADHLAGLPAAGRVVALAARREQRARPQRSSQPATSPRGPGVDGHR